MKTEDRKMQYKVLRRSHRLGTMLLLIGMVITGAVFLAMQRQYSEAQTRETLEQSIDTIMEVLETNTEEAEGLQTRVHRDNQAIVNDVAELIFGAQEAEAGVQISELAARIHAVSGDIALFVMDEDGEVLEASDPAYEGMHLLEEGIFTRDQIEHLTRSETVDDRRYSGTQIDLYDAAGLVRSDSDPIRAISPVGGRRMYFYSCTGGKGKTLVFETYADTLNALLANIGDLGEVLSNAVMQENSFLFAVDGEERFVWFDDGVTVLTGEAFSESGLQEEILKDGYSGILKRNGIRYQCRSEAYHSSLYGDGILTAVQPDPFVSGESFVTLFVTLLAFMGSAVLVLLYARFLKRDPEQIVGYDERLLKEKGHKGLKAMHKDLFIRNAEAFRAFGRQYYFKIGAARKIAPVLVLGMAVVLLASWNAQKIARLTKTMNAAEASMDRLGSLFGSSSSNTALLTAAYEQHYLTKIKLISSLLELEADALNGKEGSFLGEDAINIYLDERFNPVLDGNGRPVTSVSNSSVLKAFAEKNGIDEIFLFDDHGHMIASDNDTWKFTLSTDREDQSYAFRRILTGEAADLIQEPRINDLGNVRQYVGTTFYYCTLQGDGPLAGRYVSRKAYEAFAADGFYEYENEKYEVTVHRGMIQAGISDSRIERIMESTTPAYLMQQFEVGDGGYAMILDASPEHVCLWSPIRSDIGKTAAEMGISSSGFSGYYQGFWKNAGIKYLQYIGFNEDRWVVLNLPQALAFKGNLRTALLSMLISGIFYLILFFFCTFSDEEEERAWEALFEELIENEENHGLYKVTMSNGKTKYVRPASAKYHTRKISWNSMTAGQKMGKVMKGLSVLLGVSVIAVSLFEQKLFGPSSAFHYILTGNWDRGLNYYAGFYCVMVLIEICVCASAISLFVSFIIPNMGNRVETIGRLLLSVIRYGSVLFGVFYSMTILGISTSGVVTTAGIFSVVVGLGSQSLISDILSGIFIIFEGSFRVGDIVEINGFTGYVREIGIRTTLVEDYLGDIKIFNNAQISGILNHTKKDSYVLCKIGVSYNEDIERVEEVIHKGLPKMKGKIPGLIGDLRYSGVMKLDDSAVIIGVGGRCSENEKRFFTRRLLREMLILFRDNKVEIPFPQLTVSFDKGAAEDKAQLPEQKGSGIELSIDEGEEMKA